MNTDYITTTDLLAECANVSSMEDALKLAGRRPILRLLLLASRLDVLAEWSDAIEISRESPRGDVLRVAAEVLRQLEERAPVPDFKRFSPMADRVAKKIRQFNRPKKPEVEDWSDVPMGQLPDNHHATTYGVPAMDIRGKF